MITWGFIVLLLTADGDVVSSLPSKPFPSYELCTINRATRILEILSDESTPDRLVVTRCTRRRWL